MMKLAIAPLALLFPREFRNSGVYRRAGDFPAVDQISQIDSSLFRYPRRPAHIKPMPPAHGEDMPEIRNWRWPQSLSADASEAETSS